jgi:hypothetical protein
MFKLMEVAIGMIFIYILVSMICTAIREGIEAWLKMRATYLEEGIRRLLHDVNREGLAKRFYNHPLISSLYSGEYSDLVSRTPIARLFKGPGLPSYIPAGNFALALMDIAARGPNPDGAGAGATTPVISLEAVRTNIASLGNSQVQQALLTAIDAAQGDLNKAQANVEGWFNSAMDRVSGWYKRRTQWILFFLGLVAAVGLNINTIAIAEYLYRDDAARVFLVKKAETAGADPTFSNQNFDEVQKELDSLNLPVGWDEASKPKVWGDFTLYLGWLITALAASLGAPFWFDLLNKVMVIRSTIKPHEKSPEEASEDRQSTAQTSATMSAGGGAATGGAAGAGVTSLRPAETIIPPLDAERDIDGCGLDVADPTPDEALPESKGGVA